MLPAVTVRKEVGNQENHLCLGTKEDLQAKLYAVLARSKKTLGNSNDKPKNQNEAINFGKF